MDSIPVNSLTEQGFLMPPEWHQHAATWMAWPHNTETWPHNLLAAQREFLELVAVIAEDEPVMLLCSGEELQKQYWTAVENRGRELANVHLVEIPTNDAWVRDFAPTFVINADRGEQAGIDWGYNAWGGKYPPFDLDQAAAKQICERVGDSKFLNGKCAAHSVDFCIEGGAIEISREGIVLCTKTCALNPNRNIAMTAAKVERYFRDCLGAQEVIWLTGEAIEGDDTDGHIDQLARFTPLGTVLYADCESSDPQHTRLSLNQADLRRGLKLANRGQVELVPLPLPKSLELYGQRLPASYCNFYITNEKVIVPQFGESTDEIAIATIAEQFPDRKVVGLPSVNLAYGQGSFHCLTQQQPAV